MGQENVATHIKKSGSPLAILATALRSVSSILRSWVICCVNYQLVSIAIVASLALGLASYSIFSAEPQIHIVLIGSSFLSLVLGVFLAARSFHFFLRRAKFMSQDEFPQSELISNTGSATGLEELDNVINEHRTHIGSIEGTISEMQEEINLLEMRYSILTDNLAAAVIVHDEDGIIGYCSPYTEVLFGYALSEIYHCEDDFFLNIIHEEDKPTYKRALGYAEMGEAYRYRFRFFHKSNIEMWAEARMVPIFDEQGNIASSLSVMIDVTRSVKYERQIEENNHDLQDFTYMVSHDLKAPIVTIKGMLGVIEDEGTENLPEDTSEAIQHINKAIGRLESLVVGILEYSKLSSRELNSEPVSLSQTLDEVLSDHTQQIKDVNAHITVPSKLPTVVGDRLGMYQVFSNLIGNAIKYKSPQREPLIEIIVEQANPRTCSVLVKDNGQGIPEAMQEAVFRPFQRAHSGPIEGSGIGLACVKKLVERFGGKITLAQSNPDGSTFELVLPCSVSNSE